MNKLPSSRTNKYKTNLFNLYLFGIFKYYRISKLTFSNLSVTHGKKKIILGLKMFPVTRVCLPKQWRIWISLYPYLSTLTCNDSWCQDGSAYIVWGYHLTNYATIRSPQWVIQEQQYTDMGGPIRKIAIQILGPWFPFANRPRKYIPPVFFCFHSENPPASAIWNL